MRAGLTPVLSDTAAVEAIDEENGFAVLAETGEPFTGIVLDRWESGALKLRRAVVDGRAEGMNRSNERTGLWRFWNPDGSLDRVERFGAGGDGRGR